MKLDVERQRRVRAMISSGERLVLAFNVESFFKSSITIVYGDRWDQGRGIKTDEFLIGT